MKIRNYFLAIILVALFVACGKKGNPVTGADNEPEVPTISSIILSDSTSFLPGEILSIGVSGTDLTQNEYQAVISDSVPIILYRDINNDSSQSLQFIVPETEPGDAELNFTLDEQNQRIELEIKPYEIIEDSYTYSNELMGTIISDLEEVIVLTDSESSREKLSSVLDSLNTARAELAQLSENEIRTLARILKTNVGHFRSTSSFKSVLQDNLSCTENDQELLIKNLIAAKYATVAAIGLVAVAPYFGTWSFVVAGVGLGSVAVFADQWATLYTEVYECSTGMVVSPQDFDTGSLKRILNSDLMVTHGDLISGKIEAQYRMPQDVQSATLELRKAFSRLIDLLPDSWIELANRAFTFQQVDDAIGIEVISTNETVKVNGLSVADSLISFTLEYSRGFIDESEFELQFIKDQYNAPLTINVSLAPPLPISYSSSFNIESGGILEDTLSFDFATSIEITESPSIGSLDFIDREKGIFSYKQDEGIMGADTFSFKVSNSTGESQESTVYVSSDNNYELIIYDYNPDYDVASNSRALIKSGENLTLNNGGIYLKGLKLNGEKVITFSDDGTQYFNSLYTAPTSEFISEDVIRNEHVISVYDYSNETRVRFVIPELTLSNEVVRRIHGKTFGVYVGENQDPDWTLNFASDGTLTVNGDNSYSYGFESPSSNVQSYGCTDNDNILVPHYGKVRLPGVINYGGVMRYFVVAEDGGFYPTTRQHYCPENVAHLSIR